MAKTEARRHICEDRSSWLSMNNTGVCHVEIRGSRAYLVVTGACSDGKGNVEGSHWELITTPVRIHHCPFCGVPLGKRKKKQLRVAPTGRYARLLKKQRQ